MAQQFELASLSGWLLALFALLGIGTLRGISILDQQEPSKSSAGPESQAPASPKSSSPPPAGNWEDQTLQPLIDHFQVDGENTVNADQLLTRLGQPGSPPILTLIASMPDPDQSSNRHRFDEWIGALQRAVESQDFVLDSFRTVGPATPTVNSPTPSPTATEAPRGGPRPPAATAGVVPEADRTCADVRVGRLPGLFVFRKAPRTQGAAPDASRPAEQLFTEACGAGPEARATLLLVFIVPETPTAGLDKVILRKCLELVKKLDALPPNHGSFAQGTAFHLLAPTFSGGQASLHQVLVDWANHHLGPADQFHLISGTAMEVDAALLARNVSPHSVEFHATTHRNEDVEGAILNYLDPGGTSRIAMLQESNTSFGGESRSRSFRGAIAADNREANHDQRFVYYPFPLHISKLRGSYERRGLFHSRQNPALRTAEQLTVPFGELDNARDLIEPQTPLFTTAVDELTLDQILTDINRQQIDKVGIVATDPLDTIFLAREVRRFRPDAQIFTTQGNLLYTHPEFISDLRGMIVGSTYPLFPSNQSWSYTYQRDQTHAFFVSDNAQGVYNAVVGHLAEIFKRRSELRGVKEPNFLEYGQPFVPPHSGFNKPPIWISVVGYRGLYPLKVIRTKENQGEEKYLLDVRSLLSQPEPQPNALPDWEARHFAPLCTPAWRVLFWTVSALSALLSLVGILILVWTWERNPTAASTETRPGATVATAARSGVASHLAKLRSFLNCARREAAGNSGKSLPLTGPGLYAPFFFLLLLTGYVALTLPLYRLVMIPWVALEPFSRAPSCFRLALGAFFTTALIAVAMLATLAAAARPAVLTMIPDLRMASWTRGRRRRWSRAASSAWCCSPPPCWHSAARTKNRCRTCTCTHQARRRWIACCGSRA